jgi:iron complex transport system ATP-binding protein
VNAVVCRGLSVRRGEVAAVTEVDLAVDEGGWLAVVGPNGAGKTSLLHALAGLVPATGHVRVAGHDPMRAGRRAMARAVALMPQRPVVPEGITVRQLVTLGRFAHRRGFGPAGPVERAAVRDVLARLDLTDLADRPAVDVSGGELQRVVLARALAQDARVLLLDEPTSALDIGHQQSVLDLVDSLRLDDGLTVVAATHDLTLAGQYADRMLMLHEGRPVADAAPAAVLSADRLASVYAARVEVLDRPDGPAVLPVRDRRDRTLVLGGARSGKSRHAEALLAGHDHVLYVACGPVPDGSDDAWAERVARHRARRPPTWTTRETRDVAAALEEAQVPVLVDCLATWLAATMDAAGAWDPLQEGWQARVEADVDRLVQAWCGASVPVVAVTNEVGSGVVPSTRAGGLFRDALGLLNQRIAAHTEDVRLMVAGRVLHLSAG